MGSELHVASVPGKGTRFWFEVQFPERVRQEAAENGEPQKIIGIKGTPPTLLIADDQEENRMMLCNMLAADCNGIYNWNGVMKNLLPLKHPSQQQ